MWMGLILDFYIRVYVCLSIYEMIYYISSLLIDVMSE